MNTTDKNMALADKYAFYVPGSTLSDAAREAMRAEIEALVRENEALREKAAMHDAIQRACAELPQGVDLHIELENGAGTVRLYLPDTDADITDFGSDLTFVQQINAAIDTAMQEKQS